MFRRNFLFVLLVDLGLMLAALAATIRIKYGVLNAELWQEHFRYFLPVYILTLFFFYLYNLYNKQAFRSRYWLAVNIFSALVLSFVFAVIYLYFQPTLNITPRRFLLGNYALMLGLLVVWRWLLRAVSRRTSAGTNLLFIGEPLHFEHLNNELSQWPHLGFNKIVKYQDDSASLSDLISEQKISHVVIGPNTEVNPQVTSKLFEIVPLGLTIQPYLEFFEEQFSKIPAGSLNHSWFVNTFKYQRKPVYDFFKRLLDILFGVIGIVINAILFPFIALGIKLGGPGPVFFRGIRVGKNGKPFEIVKYRTMTVWDGNDWAQANDPRITKFGKFLRRTRMDELPQFWNILIGNMSLVGPRPEQPHIVKELSQEIPFYDQRHLIKCGLTGWAQISTGYAGNLEESRAKFEHDLYYIKKRSVAFDFEIIAHTIRIILGLKGR